LLPPHNFISLCETRHMPPYGRLDHKRHAASASQVHPASYRCASQPIQQKSLFVGGEDGRDWMPAHRMRRNLAKWRAVRKGGVFLSSAYARASQVLGANGFPPPGRRRFFLHKSVLRNAHSSCIFSAYRQPRD